SDIAESPTQRKTHSACPATSFGVAQALPPAAFPFVSAAIASALPLEWDQRATSCPALIRLRAMGPPMSPSPRNPSFAIKGIVHAGSRSAYNCFTEGLERITA